MEPAVSAYLNGPTPPACEANLPQTVVQPASTAQGVVVVQIPPIARCRATEIDLSTIALPRAVSTTWTVKYEVPAVEGVPDTLPGDVAVSPAGSDPTLMLHE